VDFAAFARISDSAKIHLAEIVLTRKSDGAEIPLYLANRDVVLGNTFYLGCLASLPKLTKRSSDILTPNSIPTWGDLVIQAEGAYAPGLDGETWDDLLSPAYNWIGVPITIKTGGDGFLPGDFVTVFTGKIGGMTGENLAVTLTVYDKGLDLENKAPDFELGESAYVIEESWSQVIPLPLGRVKNYAPPVLRKTGSYDYDFALAPGVIESLDQVYRANKVLPPDRWTLNQKDISPASKDGQGAASLETSGVYTGSAIQQTWTVQIDSIAAGPEVGQATFRWSLDGGVTWEAQGLLTWKLASGAVTKNPAVGTGIMTLGGAYTGTEKLTYQVKVTREGKIGGAPAPQFQWSDDGGATWSASVDILDTSPISLNRGLTVAFSGTVGSRGSVVKTPANSWSPSPGAMSTSGNFSGNATIGYQVKITIGGNVGTACFKWREVGDSWSGIIGVATSPILLSKGVSITFTDPPVPNPPRDDYDLDDLWEFTAYPPFLVNDLWSWSFDEIPLPLADGVAIQFHAQAGQDFYVLDKWKFILFSTAAIYIADPGVITVDVKGLLSPVTGAYVDTLADIMQLLPSLYCGWTPADFDGPAFAAFKTAIPYEVGRLVDSHTEISKIFDDLLTGVPAAYSFLINGKLWIQEIVAPSGSPNLSIGEELTGVKVSQDYSQIYRRVFLEYDRNLNTSDEESSQITQERLEWLKREYRQVSVWDDEVLNDYPLAQILGPLQTCLINRVDALAMAGKLLGLLKVSRQTLEGTAKLQFFLSNVWNLVQVNRLIFPKRDNGLYAILGIELDFGACQSSVTLWR